MVQAAKSAVGVAASQNWSLSRRIPRWRGGFAKFTQNVTEFTQIDQNVTIFSAFVKFTQIVTISGVCFLLQGLQGEYHQGRQGNTNKFKPLIHLSHCESVSVMM